MPPSPSETDLSEQPAKPANLTGRLLAAGCLVLLVLGIGVMVLNRQSLEDWWQLRGYQPPAVVAQLAAQDTMNPYTAHLFYLNKPQLLSTVAKFRTHCPEDKDTIVLGCYHPDQNGIFIYNVPDPALTGLAQVTAAHEVLHAVYARLSGGDRQALNAELNDFYKHGLSDSRVLAEIKLYQRTEPNDVLDEMSCTFGTEVAKLPAPLEAYYKRYFANRATIVAYAQRYKGEFTSRQTAITQYDQQLASMKQQIDAQQAALSYQLDQINADRKRLDGLLAAGQTSAYNASVPGYNHEIDTYNSSVDSLRTTVAAYNQLVATRNQVAGQLTTLDSAIDTRQIPQATR